MPPACGSRRAGSRPAESKQPPPPKPAKRPRNRRPETKQANKQAAKQVPAEQLEKLLNMSPGGSGEELSKLPPAQRRVFENRLNNLDKRTSATERQLDRRTQRGWRSSRDRESTRLVKLPPAQTPPGCEPTNSAGHLAAAAGDGRPAPAPHSPEFQKKYSPEEQQLIRDQFPGAAK